MKLKTTSKYSGRIKTNILKGTTILLTAGIVSISFSGVCNIIDRINVVNENDIVSFDEIKDIYLLQLEKSDGELEFILAQYIDGITGKYFYDIQTNKKVVSITDDVTMSEAFNKFGDLKRNDNFVKFINMYSSIKKSYTYSEIINIYDMVVKNYDDIILQDKIYNDDWNVKVKNYKNID